MATETVSSTDDGGHRQVSVHADGRVLAVADVDDSQDPATVHAAMHAEANPISDATGARLVDAVLDLPEVAGVDRVAAAVPAADGAILQRLSDRLDAVQTRRAGATVIVEGHPTPDDAA